MYAEQDVIRESNSLGEKGVTHRERKGCRDHPLVTLLLFAAGRSNHCNRIKPVGFAGSASVYFRLTRAL